MKKIIIMISILFIGTIGVLLYNFIDSKNYFEKDIVEINQKQVNLIDSKAMNDININDIVISNIEIKENKKLYFKIKAKKSNLSDKIITVYLYNDYTKNPGITIEKNLNEVMNGDDVIIDIEDSYNNPSTLEFDVK